jgi:hypothetical protein
MLYIILPTLYKKKSIRFELCMKTIKKIKESSDYFIIIADNSIDEIYNILLNEENNKLIVIKQYDRDLKFGAIRRAIRYINMISNTNDIICFQEPEKVGMVKYYKYIINMMNINNHNVCMPYRTEKSFTTYPKEQIYLEKFINLYIKKLYGYNHDWTFGPIFFTKNVSKYWLKEYDNLWNGQIGPIFDCIKDNISILKLYIDYIHDPKQTNEEKENIKYMDKRIYQFNYWLKFYNSK